VPEAGREREGEEKERVEKPAIKLRKRRRQAPEQTRKRE
jgi:hypothetical protein